MTITLNKKFVVSAVLSTVLSLGIGSAQAESPNVGIMKPLHGLSFKVGTHYAVSYFVNRDGVCKLVLTMAEEPNWDEVQNFATTRFEANVPAGKETRYRTEGQALAFACGLHGEAMRVTAETQYAKAPAR